MEIPGAPGVPGGPCGPPGPCAPSFPGSPCIPSPVVRDLLYHLWAPVFPLVPVGMFRILVRMLVGVVLVGMKVYYHERWSQIVCLCIYNRRL